jgi:hypothetical protein
VAGSLFDSSLCISAAKEIAQNADTKIRATAIAKTKIAFFILPPLIGQHNIFNTAHKSFSININNNYPLKKPYSPST